MALKNEVPGFPPFEFTSEKNRTTENSKKLYSRAVATALLAARHYGISPGVRRVPGLGLKAFRRLLERAGRTIA